jgi:integrase
LQTAINGGILGGIYRIERREASMDGGISSRATNKLSDRTIKAFISHHRKGQASAKKLSDGGGMFLTITSAGTPTWRIKYRFGGDERLYSIGAYPDIGLEAARAERAAIKDCLKSGRDPVQARQLSRSMATASADNTFAAIAGEWLTLRRKNKKWSDVHWTKSKQAFDRDVLPFIGKLPIADIPPAMVASVIERITGRGALDTAGKIYEHVRGVFRLAQAKGMCRDNPADPVREVLPRNQSKRRPAVLEWQGLGDILRGAEAARLSPAVRLAHRLCAFSVARISNVVQAEWPELRLDAEVPMWIIPRKKMKAQDRDHDHKIILGATITAELLAWRSLIGGKGYVFPSPAGGKLGDKHITRESLEKAYRVTLKLDGKHTPHGWRSAFSTLARDNSFERDVVEITLDHVHDNDVVRAYDRGERLKQRTQLMNWWDEQLMKAQRGADVLPMRKIS